MRFARLWRFHRKLHPDWDELCLGLMYTVVDRGSEWGPSRCSRTERSYLPCEEPCHTADPDRVCASLPAQRKPTTSNQFGQAGRVSTWRMARAGAKLVTLGRRPQKTLVLRNGKPGGLKSLGNARKPPRRWLGCSGATTPSLLCGKTSPRRSRGPRKLSGVPCLSPRQPRPGATSGQMEIEVVAQTNNAR
jgi:hypothetical protein